MPRPPGEQITAEEGAFGASNTLRTVMEGMEIGGE